MTLGGVISALRVRWLVLVLATLIGGVGAVGLAVTTPKTYVATSTVLIRTQGAQPGVASYTAARYARTVARSYRLFIGRDRVMQEAVSRATTPTTLRQARRAITADVPTDTAVIRVRATTTRPELSAALSGAAMDALIAEIGRETAQGTQVDAATDAVVAIRAPIPVRPAGPQVTLYGVAGAFAGLVAGVLVAIIWAVAAAIPRPRSAIPIPSPPPLSRRLTGAHVVWVLLLAAILPWRSNTFYEGGADPVVLAKAAISLVALGGAWWLFERTRVRHPVAAAPVLLLLVYLAVTTIGGIANNDVQAAAVVAVRVVIVMLAVCCIVAAYGARYAMRSLVQVLTVVAVSAAVSGMTHFGGRLGGVVPPLNPNALAFITAVVGLWLVAKVLAGVDAWWELIAVGACVGVIYLTGSRTALAAFALAAVLMTVRATALRRRTLVVSALALPGLVLAVAGTDALSSVFLRGGEGQVTTLSNRTIAWEAALNLDRDVWQTWFGQGLAQKKIEVPGQWWETQLLDSSWISAFVQGGYLGVAFVLALAILTVGYALFCPRAQGAVWLGLSVLTLVGGFLESGLFDGTIQFMVLLVTALGAVGSAHPAVRVDRVAVTSAR